MAVLLLQLLFSTLLVLGSGTASSPAIDDAGTAVIDNPRESFAKYSVSKVQTDRNPLVFSRFHVLRRSPSDICVDAGPVLEPPAAFICITASINHLTPL